MHSAVQNWDDPTDRQATLLAFWQREHGRRIWLAQEESDLAGGRIERLGRVAIWGRRIGDRLLHADENGHSVDGWRISSFKLFGRGRQGYVTDDNGDIYDVRYPPEDGRRILSFKLFGASFRFCDRRRQESYTDENGVTWTREENYTDENGNEHEMWYAPEE
jgi:hypothetical protein